MSIGKKDAVKSIFAVLYTLLTAFIAGQFTDTDSEWFVSLEKSPLMPPGIVFIIVWAVLYMLVAISFALTLVNGGKAFLFMLVLALLSLWCYVFFIKQQPVEGLILIIVILILSIMLFKYAYGYLPAAGYLILPLCLWLAYAAAINYQTVLLN